MSNASKAIIIAGGLLIAVLVISLCMYAYTAFKSIYADNMKLYDVAQIESFNLFFVGFPSEITGYEAYNIIGKIEDTNKSPDSITTIVYSGIDKKSEFYFTENFERKYSYFYEIDEDGLISAVTINKIEEN